MFNTVAFIGSRELACKILDWTVDQTSINVIGGIAPDFETWWDDKFGEYLSKNNLTIDSFNSFNLNYDSEIAQVSLESLKESIAKINLDNVDGLFVSCTALKIVDILDEVEKKFNTTVISSNQAIIWDCLKLLDMNVKISGYGKLFNS